MTTGADAVPRVSSAVTRSARKRTVRPVAVIASTAMTWLATAIAATAFWPVYETPRFVIMVAVTTAAATVISAGAAVLRFPGQVVALATVFAYVLFGVPLAVPEQAAFGVLPTATGLVDLAGGTVFGWKQLLTITLPVGDFQALLVPAFIVVLVTVTVSLSIALRLRIGEFAVIGPIVLFLCGILLGPTTEFAPLAAGLALTAVLLLWTVWFRLDRRRAAILAARGQGVGVDTESGATDPGDTASAREPLRGSVRSALTAVLIIAIASGAAVAATVAVPPSADRRVLRSTVVQPFDPRQYPSPLSGFRAYHETALARQTILTVQGLPAGDRLRIATLDSYDGVVYAFGDDRVDSPSGSFVLVPSGVDRRDVDGERVQIEVTVGDYSGVWVPTTGLLETVEFEGADAAELRGSFYFNDNSGTAAVIGGLAAGDRYRLTAVAAPAVAGEAIAGLEPGDAPVPAVRNVPQELTDRLAEYTSGVGEPGARLAAAIAGLREEGYISHGVGDEEASRSGHSTGRIAQLFSDPRMIGDEEQYAVAAALMARELGFPSRVVMGFAPDATGSTTRVIGDDVSAWIEVDTVDSGWVAIDPTPLERDIPEEPPQEPAQVAPPQQPVQPPVDEPTIPEDQTPPDSEQDEPAAPDALLTAVLIAVTVVGWIAVIAGLIASPFIAIVAVKWRRRRRRRNAADPLDRISGGWDEFEDAVIDHGYPEPASSTRSEFAQSVGGSRAVLLAASADRAVFAPDRPDDADAERVWGAVGELSTTLDRGLTRWQRFRARVSLRSLRSGDADGTGASPEQDPRPRSPRGSA